MRWIRHTERHQNNQIRPPTLGLASVPIMAIGGVGAHRPSHSKQINKSANWQRLTRMKNNALHGGTRPRHVSDYLVRVVTMDARSSQWNPLTISKNRFMSQLEAAAAVLQQNATNTAAAEGPEVPAEAPTKQEVRSRAADAAALCSSSC